MRENARFMFEYGHALHKLHEPELSNKVLKEALKVSGDPMILNIIGKNEQEMKYNPQNHPSTFLKRSVSILRFFSKTKRLF